MPKIKLTQALLKSNKKHDKATDYFDTSREGLFLRVSPKGRKTFYFRYFLDGKHENYRLGKYPDIYLSDARTFVDNLRGKIAKGENPQAERRKRKKTPVRAETVSDLTFRFMKYHVSNLKPKTQSDYKWHFDKYILPKFGEIELKELTRRDISSFLEDIAKEYKTLSNRIHSTLSSMLNYGLDNEFIEVNPMHRLKKKGIEKSRDRFLTDEEIKKVWNAIEQQAEPVRGLYKFFLLCGQRSGETKRMMWDHIEDDVWVIPAAETKKSAKNAKDHPVPLSVEALQVLKDLKKITGNTPYVFATIRYHSDEPQPIEWLQKSVVRLRDVSGVKDFRIHDMRRTVASNLAKLEVSRTIIGKILNHADIADDRSVTAIYDRHSYLKEKREALQKWSTHLYDHILSEK